MKFTLSLRTKFTLVLLITSLLALLAGGIIARTILVKQFSTIVSHQSFQRFHTEITAYLEAYGSWEQAQQKESFGAFAARRQHLLLSPSSKTSTLFEEKATEDFVSPSTPSQSPAGFALADPNGRILMGTNQLKPGMSASPQLLQHGKQVILNGSVVAIALPNPQPNLQHLNAGYFKAIQLALISAAFTAGLFALFFGLIIGSRVNGRLSRLSTAIKEMRAGNLHQHVDERSGDEIGMLATTFNQMSAELAEMHEALQKSHLQIEKQAKKLKELTIRDDLTGLYNRRYINKAGARIYREVLKNSQQLTVAMSDIDFFKEINDGYSHAIGDEVLRQIAKIFHNNARSGDVIARYGGEEFVLILPRTSLLSAAALCERLRKKIEEYPWTKLAPDLYVTMSFGLCDDTTCGSFEKQLEKADDKLREAKLDGRNLVCFDIAPGGQDAKMYIG